MVTFVEGIYGELHPDEVGEGKPRKEGELLFFLLFFLFSSFRGPG
jgi:hypothetical protein